MTGIKESEFITRIQLGIIKELYKNKKISDAEYSYVFNKYNKKLESFNKTLIVTKKYIDDNIINKRGFILSFLLFP